MTDTGSKLRIIKTARNVESINAGVKKGFKAIVKKVQPSPEIRVKFCILQHKVTGEVKEVGDYRAFIGRLDSEEYDKVIDWTYYYPYQFESPFAAYLIPPDIKVGERVFVKDLIEDFVGSRWNQSDTYRLESCEAIWDGSELVIQYDPRKNRAELIG